MLPKSAQPLETLSVSAGSERKNDIAFYNGYTKEVLFRGGESSLPHFLRVNRAKLRACLSAELEINWNKQFVKHELDGDIVRVVFADGSSAEGNILIGADGVSSPGTIRSIFRIVSSANQTACM